MRKKALISFFLVLTMLFAVVTSLADSLEVPELDSLYPSITVKLNGMSNESRRVFAYYGPGDSYLTAHGYKPYKQLGITAYYSEGGWVLIHLKYKTAKERFLYIADSAFNSLNGLITVAEMHYYTGKTVSASQPRLGPSDSFISEEDLRSLPAGTDVKVFFQKNDYYFAEFQANGSSVRMWVPASCVEITGSGSYTPVHRRVIRVRNTDIADNQRQETVYTGETRACHCGGIMTGTYSFGWDFYNETVHSGGGQVTYTCQLCGNQMFEGGDDTVKEPHTFVNGVCSVCGYIQNSSIHCSNCGGDMIPTYWRMNEIPLDGNYHTVDEYMEYECRNCYSRTGMTFLGKEKEPHFFDDNDNCMMCHYHDYGD